MAKKRRTESQRQAEWQAEERRAWETFRERFEGTADFVRAELLAHDSAIRPDSPGRRFYSNLAYFLGGFHCPGDSSHAERRLYIKFLERIDEAGQLKEGAAAKYIEALRQALKGPSSRHEPEY